MAKVKSKKITIEDALVPVEEQPYEVPKNWCWIHWGDAGEFIAGSGFKNQYQGYNDYDIPFYKVGSLKYSDFNGYLYDNSNTINEDMRAELKATLIPINSVLFAKIGEAIRLNRRSLNSVPCCIDNNMMAFLAQKCDYKYAFYWSRGLDLYNYTNATTVPAIRKSDLEKIPFPLPPLLEQQRIVEQIESLFSKLDEAREKAQEALDSFEVRRTAILHKAFEGKLTSQWRKDHGIDINSWKIVPLKRCGRWFGGGTPTTSKKEYWEGGNIPWITSKDMKDKVIEDSLMHITMAGVDNSSANYCEEPAVLFVMRSGILRRVFPVCMVQRPFTVNQDLKACVPEGIAQEYLYWYCSGYEKDIRDNCMKSGTTVESVEAKKLFDYKIRVAGDEEQKEIVNCIEKLMDKEAAAYDAAEKVIESIDIVKKSILAKSFRGELGTNNLSDEPAEELLKRILTDTPVEEKKKSTTRKKKVKVVMNKDLLEAVREARKITPERLKEVTGLGIDEFYEELKRLTESGQVSEKKEGGDVYLEVKDANR